MKTGFAILLGAITPAILIAQQEPDYVLRKQVSGLIRSFGNQHQGELLKLWQQAFQKHQPGVRFENRLEATANAIGALSFGLCEIGLMGREIWPMEDIGFRRLFHTSPLEIAIASGSYDVPLKTSAFAIMVHQANPIRGLTMQQLDAIFGTERKRGASENLRTWGQLGLTGEWKDRKIQPYGYALGTGLSTFIQQFVMEGSFKWNPDIREYSNISEGERIVTEAGWMITRDLSQDPGGIAYVPIPYKTTQTKSTPISLKNGGPYVQLTHATVADRSYPLARSVYFYINPKMDDATREFLLFVLSRQGSEAARKQNVFLALPPWMLNRERGKLDQ